MAGLRKAAAWPRNVGRGAQHTRTGKPDFRWAALALANARVRSAHLTEAVDRARLQQKAIKMIKRVESMSCEESWRAAAREQEARGKEHMED